MPGFVDIQRSQLVYHCRIGTAAHRLGKFQRIRALHTHAAVAAYTGYAARGIGAVDAQAQLGIA